VQRYGLRNDTRHYAEEVPEIHGIQPRALVRTDFLVVLWLETTLWRTTCSYNLDFDWETFLNINYGYHVIARIMGLESIHGFGESNSKIWFRDLGFRRSSVKNNICEMERSASPDFDIGRVTLPRQDPNW
jgi:hypothetical protein